MFFCQLKIEEINGITKDFVELGFLAPTGLFLGGTKYMIIQGEPGAVIRGKKVTFLSINPCLHIFDREWNQNSFYNL